ncbi:hypothetical protein GCM10025760_28090 [Microbacterium yannicii]|uniref:N-acetyltransferase domain-containing protein n=1 Tax=Microbacterium yannicii TaxID=671622 RepID=A0ABP9MHJ8_9MICO|nr:GNAT family N-acetyltransferase [Microbacterium yannicii]MCO5953407.1 GNAT family N-acetyltransferase [Microbacterium yannicii]
MSAVLFRSDATLRGGIGHFVRTVAIAEELVARGRRAVLSGEIESPLALQMVRTAEITVVPPAMNSGELLEQAAEIDAAMIHIDRYEGFSDIRALARGRGTIISTATDAQYGRRPADVIVDAGPRATHEFHELYADADVCLGPDHALLRRGLSAAATHAGPARRSGVHALVLMGGTDAADYGPAVARAAAGVAGVTRVGLVGAPGPAPGVIPVPRSPDVTELLDGWDLVITAAGTTVWEMAALGVPMALIGVAENQRDHYDTLLAAGAAVGLGFLPSKDELAVADLAEVIADADARLGMAERARRIVDGRGAARVVDVWDAVAADRVSASLELRPAAMRDAGRLYAWRNDPLVRRQSRHIEAVRWPEHLSWLRRSLDRPERRLYVANRGGPVGTVRLDATAPGEWEVSATVAPHQRGRGIGSQMIDRALTTLARDGGRTVTAELRHDNDSSRALFRRSGFIAVDSPADGWERWVKRL